MNSRRPTRRSLFSFLALASIAALFFWAGNAAVRARRTAGNDRRELAQRSSHLDAEIVVEEGRLAALAARERQASDSGRGAARAGSNQPFHANDPKIDRFFLRMYRAGLAVRFGPFYQRLGLSPAQISQFEGLLTAHRETLLELHELRAVDVSEGGDGTASELIEIEQEAQDSRNAGLLALLGPDGLQQFLDEERIDPARQFLLLVTQGGYPPQPLSAVQTAEMISAMEDASASFQAGGILAPAALDWGAILARTRGVLSAEQLESLNSVVHGYEMHRLMNSYFAR